jgi:hypothetical protein
MSANRSISSSPKSAVITLLLCLFLGALGAHRFYVGKVKTGILMLLTLGGFGIWTLVDLVLIVCSDFKDSEGRVLIYAKPGSSPLKYVMGILALFAGVLTMCVGVIFVTVLLATDSLTSVVKAQLAAIRAGELDKAYGYSAAGFQEETSYTAFKTFVNTYPVIRNNTGVSFTVRELENDQGYLQGVVHSKQGELPIEYQLVLENKTWKILGLRVNPAAEEEASREDQSGSQVESKSIKNLTYENKFAKYTIQYPDNWYYENSDKYSVLFSGLKGTPAYASTVTIQMLPMKKSGGLYKDAKAVAADLKKQIKEKTQDVKFLGEGSADLPGDGSAYHGEYFEVKYTYKGLPIHKMQYVIVTPDGSTAYSWGYTTDEERYSIDLPVAKAMYESWVIQK